MRASHGDELLLNSAPCKLGMSSVELQCWNMETTTYPHEQKRGTSFRAQKCQVLEIQKLVFGEEPELWCEMDTFWFPVYMTRFYLLQPCDSQK